MLIPSALVVTGWLLLISLLVLGGVLSTLGDRLGSRVGKARLSIFNLRPRSTAVLITVITGSLISTLSFCLMLLVSPPLRVGLFELDDLQNEFGQLENNLLALRKGDVVLSSGQPLVTATLRLETPKQAKRVIDRLLQEANLEAFRRVRPGEEPNRQILLVPRSDIGRLEEIIRKEGTWVVSLRSAANVLLGENLVYAFPQVRPNTRVVSKGEVLARTTLLPGERTSAAVRKRIKLLLASTLAEVKRRGSLSSGLQFDSNSINDLGQGLIQRKVESVELEALALRSSDTAEQVAIVLQTKGENRPKGSNQET